MTRPKREKFDNDAHGYYDRFKTVTFGKYEQDGDVTNGMEPIEWFVLDEKDDKVLLISKKVIITIFFHNFKNERVKWDKSILRLFLNMVFYEESFTDSERKAIVETKVINNYKNSFGHSMGIDTMDHIFVLNQEELMKYFKNDNERRAEGTKYGGTIGLSLYSTLPIEENAFMNASYYWVRDVGYSDNDVSCVNHDGSINIYGYQYETNGIGVRPCIWIKKDAL